MRQDIAIIGMAGRFPDAYSLEELNKQLTHGYYCLREIDEERLKRTTLDPNAEYHRRAWLEDIDCFDHDFFGISKAEANHMDPHQRILLEVVYETFENAAYSWESVSGSETSIFVADTTLDYYQHADEFAPTLLTGNVSEFLASRVSRVFNLKGGAFMLDTSCSSSLVALHHACNELKLGHIEMALVASVNLELFPEKGAIAFDVGSPDGNSRPFTSSANGMANGEMAGCLLLKPLDQALLDGDQIHGVIRGSALNNNANRSASMTAPDSVAQSEVITKAWKRAEISPKDLGFIEAHGSGTQLGDSIEVAGLNIAMNAFGAEGTRVPISSIKSNIGHSRIAAGLAGLIKVLLSFKYDILHPHAQYDEPSALINFDRSSVYVQEEAKAWPSQPDKARIAGISSMGLSGTNAHVVLAEGPEPAPVSNQAAKRSYFIPLSAKTSISLLGVAERLLLYIESHPELAISDVAFTLSQRSHFSKKIGFVCEDLASLSKQLRGFLSFAENETPVIPSTERIILLLTDLPQVSDLSHQELVNNYPAFGEAYSSCLASLPEPSQPTKNQKAFAFLYAWHQLMHKGLQSPYEVLSLGMGALVLRTVQGEISLEEGLAQAENYQITPISNLAKRTEALVGREIAKGRVSFLAIDEQEALTKSLLEYGGEGKDFDVVIPTSTPATLSLLSTWQALFVTQVDLKWDEIYPGGTGRKIDLPTYAFEKVRCWVRETHRLPQDNQTNEEAEPTPIEVEEADASHIAKEIALIWQKVLKLTQKSISLESNFFHIKGNSLLASRVIGEIQKTFGVRLDFEDIFDYPMLGELADFVGEELDTESFLLHCWREILQKDKVRPEDDFFELGGHSLMANQLLSRIRKAFKVNLDFEDIFRNPTALELAAFIDEYRRTNKEEIVVKEIEQAEVLPDYPLSHTQLRVWLLSRYADGGQAYYTSMAYELTGSVDVGALESSFRLIIDRHEILRTVFISREGSPRQKVTATSDFSFSIRQENISHLSTQTEKLKAFLSEESIRPFDLENGPLFRVNLFQTAPDNYILQLNIHHLISDGWSLQVMFKELVLSYESLLAHQMPSLPSLKLQYKDYTLWQQNQMEQESFEEARKFWLERFEGEIKALNLPTDRPRPAQTRYAGSMLTHMLPKELLDRFQFVLKKQDASLFMGLLAAVKVLLRTYARQDDITLGTPHANRGQVEFESQIGFYANTLALRSIIDPQKGFDALLQQIKELTLKAYKHSFYPFDQLVEELDLRREASRSPLFDVMIALHNMDHINSGSSSWKGMTVTPYEVPTQNSQFDLNFEFSPLENGLELAITYDTDLFDAWRIKQMAQDLADVIEALSQQTKKPLGQLDWLKTKALPATKKERPSKASAAFQTQFATITDGQRAYKAEKWKEKAQRLVQAFPQMSASDTIAIEGSPSLRTLIVAWAAWKTGKKILLLPSDIDEKQLEKSLTENQVQLFFSKKDIPSENCLFIDLEDFDWKASAGAKDEVEWNDESSLEIIYSTPSQQTYSLNFGTGDLQGLVAQSGQAPSVMLESSEFNSWTWVLGMAALEVGEKLILFNKSDEKAFSSFWSLSKFYKPDQLHISEYSWKKFYKEGYEKGFDSTSLESLDHIYQYSSRGYFASEEVSMPYKQSTQMHGCITVEGFCLGEASRGSEGASTVEFTQGFAFMIADANQKNVPLGVPGKLYIQGPQGWNPTQVWLSQQPNGNIAFEGNENDFISIDGYVVDQQRTLQALYRVTGVSQAGLALAQGTEGKSEVEAYLVPKEAAVFSSQNRYIAKRLSETPDYTPEILKEVQDTWPSFSLSQGPEELDVQMWMDHFAAYHILLEGHEGQIQGIALGLPIEWNGNAATLPMDWGHLIRKGQLGIQEDNQANTLCVIQALPLADSDDPGIVMALLDAMKSLAHEEGFKYVLSAAKPDKTLSEAEFEQMLQQPAEDVKDTSLRWQLAQQGKLIGLCRKALEVRADLDQWQNWTGTPYTASGKHELSQSSFPLQVDVEQQIGIYREPIVWVQHQVSETSIFSAKDLHAGDIKRSFFAQMPSYQIPARMWLVDDLPIFMGGTLGQKAWEKLEKRPLSEGTATENAAFPQESPYTDVLVQVCREVLFNENIQAGDNFFLSGGDSIKALQIVSRLFEKGFQLNLKSLFQADTLQEAAIKLVSLGEGSEQEPVGKWSDELVSEENRARLDEAYDWKDVYPLSPMQEGMLFHAMTEKDSMAYFEQVVYRIEDPTIQPALIQKSLNYLSQRHEILRTVFNSPDLDPLLQLVLVERDIPFHWEDLTGLAASEQESRLEDFRKQDAQRRFQLDRDALVRMAMFQLSDKEHVLIWSSHHILMDGWCIAQLTQEFKAAYEAFSQGTEPNLPSVVQYNSYLRWLDRQDNDQAESFWKSHLEGYNEMVSFSRKSHSQLSAEKPKQRMPFALSAEQTLELQQLAQKHRVTLNTVIQAVWGILLGRYNEKSDVAFGAVVSGRPANLRGVEQIIGLFINTIPVRVEMDREMSFASLLQDLQEAQLAGESYHHFPLSRIQSNSELQGDLFDHIMVFENYPIEQQLISTDTQEGWKITDVEMVEQNHYPFSIVVFPNEAELTFSLDYHPDAYSSEEMEQLKSHLQLLFDQVCAQVETPLKALSLVSDEQEETLLTKFNGPQTFKSKQPSIKAWFEEVVASNPSAIALKTEEVEVSYGELNKAANQLAHRLIDEHGAGPGKVVAFWMPRSVEMLTSMMAIMKTGAAFLPLNPYAPAERLAFMLAQSEAVALVFEDQTPDFLEKTGIAGLGYTSMKQEAGKWSTENPDPNIDLEDTLYVIFTSGSTGKPKGVEVPNRGLSNYIEWFLDEFEVEAKDGSILLSSVAADLSYSALWPAILGGGTLRLLPSNPHLDLEDCFRAIEDPAVNFLKLTPTHFNLLVEDHRAEKVIPSSNIRFIMMGGEALQVKDLEKYYSLKSDTRIVNEYGPTEATIGTTFCDVPASSIHVYEKTQVIGAPIENYKLYVLDENKDLVPQGFVGELHIAGPGVAKGYLGREDLTAERFLPNPFSEDPQETVMYKTGDLGRWLSDGTIEFLGRRDHQVKIRGYRIELSEIESALKSHPDVSLTTVRVKQTAGKTWLVAYLETQADFSVQEIRTWLSSYLPTHMLPDKVVCLDRFPKLGNGKIDRKALDNYSPKESEPAVTHQAARTEEEKLLVGIWESILDKSNPSINDNFFEMGGDSIKAIRITSQVAAKGYQLAVRDVMIFPTIEALASRLVPIEIDEVEAEPVVQSGPVVNAPLSDDDLANLFN